MTVDGAQRRAQVWAEWAVTTRLDCSGYWRRAWEAVICHRTQLPAYESLLKLPAEKHEALWGRQRFYRAMSLVNGGRRQETDLLEGLR